MLVANYRAKRLQVIHYILSIMIAITKQKTTAKAVV